MTTLKLYRVIAYALIAIPISLFVWKWYANPSVIEALYPKESYTLTYEFDLSNLPEQTFIKAYLPQNREDQQISNIKSIGDSLVFSQFTDTMGLIGEWRTDNEAGIQFQYQFDVTGKQVTFAFPEETPFQTEYDELISQYLASSEHIQSNHPIIDSIAQQLRQQDVKSTLQANFDFINTIQNSNTGLLTDALTTLQRNRASCNGKSRLFVALCRAQGIPARVVGGIILENTRKRTSHLWAAVHYQNHWIPFDALNQHFAKKPANYLELYTGDDFLIKHTKGINLDYQFTIKRKYNTASAGLSMPLWPLINQSDLPLDLLKDLLLLPIAAVIVALMRNIIGLKTFGIFLPALIALALANFSFWWGLFAFGIVIGVVALLHFPLEKLGLLHTPKLVIMLTSVVLILLSLSYVGVQRQWVMIGTSVLLPVVVLTITAERFAKTLLEENLADAAKMLGYTFLIAFICYPIFNSQLLVGIFMTYPEFYLSILGIMILLGRWIGLRIFEYRRFAKLTV